MKLEKQTLWDRNEEADKCGMGGGKGSVKDKWNETIAEKKVQNE